MNFFAFSFVIFCLFEFTFIVALLLSPEFASAFGGSERGLSATLIFSSLALVAANTAWQINEGYTMQRELIDGPSLNDAEKKFLKSRQHFHTTSLLLSLFLAAGLSITVILASIQAIRGVSWAQILKLNEIISCFIFFVFVLSGFCSLQILRFIEKRINSHAPKISQAVSSTRSKTKLILIGVDLPCFISVLFVALIGRILASGDISFFYWHGFSAGAIGILLALSQIALAFLASSTSLNSAT